MATNTGSGSTASPKRTPRKRAAGTRSSGAASRTASARAATLTDDAKSAVRTARTRARRAVGKVPTDTASLSIGAGIIAGIVAAGVAIFMNRDRLRTAASSSGERIRKAADDLSAMAHDRIDQARDNITRLRSRDSETAAEQASMTGSNSTMSAPH